MQIAIIVGHPRTGTFCEAIAHAYERGAFAAGHTVRVFSLGQLKFDPILHEGFERAQPLEDDLEAVRSFVMGADHLVFIFPLWLGSMPALLKGFFERVFQPDLVGPAQHGQFPELLTGRSSRVVVTMGMPAAVYRWWFGAHEVRMLRRNILRFLGIRRVRCTYLGRVSAVSQKRRAHWLADMQELGARAQ